MQKGDEAGRRHAGHRLDRKLSKFPLDNKGHRDYTLCITEREQMQGSG